MEIKKNIKLLIINILVLLFLLLSLELIWRIALSIKHIQNPHISYFGKTWFRENPVNLGQFDEKLLKTLKPNLLLKNVDLPRWEKNSTISSNSLGFRNNSNNIEKFENGRILAVGDSFTFGDQTSDQSTWPSCLERKLSIKTDNGGYGGYSSSQAVRKAIIESNKREYSHIIWSVYFHDFERDFSTKLLTKNSNGEIVFNNFIENNIITKNNNNIKTYWGFLKEYSFLLYHIDTKVLRNYHQNFNINIQPGYKNNSKEKIFGIDKKLMEENIYFLLEKFNNLNIKNKIIIYQYGDWSKNSSNNPDKNNNYDNNQIKKIINKIAKNYEILIIDSADVLLTYDDLGLRKLWFDHHTREGNQVVCKFIVKKLIENKYVLN